MAPKCHKLQQQADSEVRCRRGGFERTGRRATNLCVNACEREESDEREQAERRAVLPRAG